MSGQTITHVTGCSGSLWLANKLIKFTIYVRLKCVHVNYLLSCSLDLDKAIFHCTVEKRQTAP